jgi:esterase/lipase superfamily enzyme
MGELEGPSIWKLEFREKEDRHVMVLRDTFKSMERRGFLRSVEQKVRATSNRRALVFVHGFDNTFEEAARRTAQISYDLGFSGATVLYSWPSRGVIGLQSYLKDADNARASEVSLERLLEDLRDGAGATSIHVVAHSMGNRLVAAALARIAEKKPSVKAFRQVALLAPDISVRVFQSLAASFCSAADRVTLYASSDDAALRASARLQGGPRLGQGGANIVSIPPIDSIDVTGVKTSTLGFSHQYYGDSRTVLGDLFNVLRGIPAADRKGLRRSRNGRYWALLP